MQVIIIIVMLLSYVLLLPQYKMSSKSGAKDIAEALSGKCSLQLLNRRTGATAPALLISLVLSLATDRNIFLRCSWNQTLTLFFILLCCLCFLVSFYSGFQVKRTLNAGISINESISYLSLRIPGLIIYEMFFRGVLLGISLEWFSIPVSVAFNIGLYALAHTFSSRKEFIGSIPFGLLLCYVTILSESIFPAVILHLCLALPYESILLIKYQLLTKKIRS
jgi:membrane protease YdiL (CAAX protease family)